MSYQFYTSSTASAQACFRAKPAWAKAESFSTTDGHGATRITESRGGWWRGRLAGATGTNLKWSFAGRFRQPCRYCQRHRASLNSSRPTDWSQFQEFHSAVFFRLRCCDHRKVAFGDSTHWRPRLQKNLHSYCQNSDQNLLR